MSKSRKKTQRQSVYGETVTSLNTNYQINQHLGIETIHEEEQKMTNINNNNNNNHMSYIDILRSMEKGNEITNTNDNIINPMHSYITDFLNYQASLERMTLEIF